MGGETDEFEEVLTMKLKRKLMNKIYCGNCKYFKPCTGGASPDYCRATRKKAHGYSKWDWLYERADERNKNNDCKFYQPRWWKSAVNK